MNSSCATLLAFLVWASLGWAAETATLELIMSDADWTGNPPVFDPEAYQRSSPINHAAGLQDPLLIAVGMQDDNVFFQDFVLLVQRLIELQKEDFEIAIYPLDAHSFVHPDSWLDEYRRIFRLMETNLK